jgi:flagellar protein FlgJ
MDLIAGTALDLPRPAAALPRIDAHAAPEELRRVAEEFEAVFLGQMLEYMFDGIDTDGPFGGGQGERVFRSLLLQEYGKATAARGGIGIADSVLRQLIAAQEVAP